MTHVRQVSEGHVRTTELVLEKNEPKNWGKLLTLSGTERELSDNCRAVSSTLKSLGLRFPVKGPREGVVLLPAWDCVHSPERLQQQVGVFS